MNNLLETLRATRAIGISEFNDAEKTAIRMISTGPFFCEATSWTEAAVFLFSMLHSEQSDLPVGSSDLSDLDGIDEKSAFEIIRGLAEAFTIPLTINAMSEEGPILIFSMPQPVLGKTGSCRIPPDIEDRQFDLFDYGDIPLSLDEMQEALGSREDEPLPDDVHEEEIDIDRRDLAVGDLLESLAEDPDCTAEAEADTVIPDDDCGFMSSEEMQASLGVPDDQMENVKLMLRSVRPIERDFGVKPEADPAGNEADDGLSEMRASLDFSSLENMLEDPSEDPIDPEDIGISNNDIVTIVTSDGKIEICYIIDRRMEENARTKARAADMGAKPVMTYSPKGKALLGRHLHDDVSFKVQRRVIVANITEIIRPDS